MRILITGGSGFIAKELKRYFERDKEHTVLTLSRYDVDLLDSEAVESWSLDHWTEFDVIVHTATTGGSRLQGDPIDVFYNNITMYKNIAYMADKYQMLLFNFDSGASDEHADSLDLTKPYGASKYVISRLIETERMNIINLKIWNCFGESGLPTRFIEGNIERAIRGEDLIIHQDKMYDFFYSEDLYKVIVNFIQQYGCNALHTQTVNCLYETSESLYSVAKMIQMISGTTNRTITFEQPGFDNVGYSGLLNYTLPEGEYIGLIEGIRAVYRKKEESLGI